jgi:hypothetical protein
MMDSKPEWSAKLAQNVHFQSYNSRLNVSSPDNSTNFVSVSSKQLFVHLREKACSIADDTERNDIVTRLDELQKAQGSPCCVSPDEPTSLRRRMTLAIALWGRNT